MFMVFIILFSCWNKTHSMGFGLWLWNKNCEHFRYFYIYIVFSFNSYCLGSHMIKSVNKWLIYRFSSLILTPIVFWLVVNMPKNIFVNQNNVENFINDNLNFSVLVIAYLLISVNIKIGINEVFEDYIHNEFYKNVAKWVISVLIIVISFLAIISMLIIRLWVHTKL